MNISAISPTPRARVTSTPSTNATQPPALISTSPIAAHMAATIANTATTAIAATATAIQLDRARTPALPAPWSRRAQHLGDLLQVFNKPDRLAMPGFLVGRPQQRGGMDRGKRIGRPARLDQPAAVARDAKGLAEQRLRRGRAERDDDAWLHFGDLRFEPGETRGDLHRAGLAVNAPGAARDPFEMLDRVRHIAPAAIDSRGFEAAIEQLTGPADK